MPDVKDQLDKEMGALTKLASKVPGFAGYINRENRRNADEILREAATARCVSMERRLSAIQVDLAASGQIKLLDDCERISLQLRTFADKLRTAARGYAGFFDAIKIDGPQLDKLYEFDLALLDLVEKLSRNLDSLEEAVASSADPLNSLRDLTAESARALEILESRTQRFAELQR